MITGLLFLGIPLLTKLYRWFTGDKSGGGAGGISGFLGDIGEKIGSAAWGLVKKGVSALLGKFGININNANIENLTIKLNVSQPYIYSSKKQWI